MRFRFNWCLAIGAVCSLGSLVSLAASAEGAADGFLRKLDETWPTNVSRASDGTVIGLIVPFDFTNERNLALIGQLSKLAELKLYASSTSLSPRAVADLRSLSHLTNLTIACALVLQDNVLEAVGHLETLRSLTLNSSVPPTREYPVLTNLLRLEELTILGASNFGDKELKLLESLPNLRRLTLGGTGVSDSWPAAVRQFPSLVNAVVTRRGESLRWSRTKD